MTSTCYEGIGNSNVFDTNTVPVTDWTAGWHHIAVSSSNTGAMAWIDGSNVWSGGAITLARSGDSLGLGDAGTGTGAAMRFNGWMDEVRFHDSAVDQTYIDGRVALLSTEVTEYSFENSLNDSALGGVVSDTLSYVQGASGSGGPVYMDGVVVVIF